MKEKNPRALSFSFTANIFSNDNSCDNRLLTAAICTKDIFGGAAGRLMKREIPSRAS
jgi:hypothetical protein